MREVYLVYQCPDPDCGLIGLLHDYEFTTKPTPPFEGSWVPCPLCDEPMIELRKAEGMELVNPIRLTRYLQGGAIFTLPISSLMNPSTTSVESDSSKDFPVKRQTKTSIKALAYGLLRADQVAKTLGLSIQTVRGLWRDGQLGYIQFNKKQRMSNNEQIEEYLRSKTAPTALPIPKAVIRAVSVKRLRAPEKTPIEDVRRKLSFWDEPSDSDNEKT